ncbi:MAG TPA: tetratricopeptide repeat protein [Bacteroidales bacterium]|nr:tetratricopeptide repeat protein [Bacteroidales bacterium]
MRQKASRILTVAVLAALALNASAQTGAVTGTAFGHGEDSTRCLRNTSLYSTYYENKDYKMALKFWRPVFNECPGSSKNTYIKGEAMYKDLFRKTGEKAYIDTVLMVLNQRTKYFNESAFNDLRKSIALYELGGNDPDYSLESFKYIKGVMETSPQNFDHTFSTLYMAVAARCYSLKVIEAPEVINAYSETMKIVDRQLVRKPDDTRYIDARKNIDAVFKSSGAATCSNLETLFTPRVETNPADTALLKKVLSLLTETGCLDSELYFKAATNLYNKGRTAVAAAQLAEMNYARKKFNEAEKYYTEAISLETNAKIKANLLTKLASLELTSDSKQTARDYAKQAYSLDNTNGNALFIIGESYAGARMGESFENQTVYWVVVDYLVKAKNTDPSLKEQADGRIEIYSKLYPTKEEGFFRSIIEEGSSYQVGGWVNEYTTVRFRKE